jgi:hypothetical protein
MNPAFESGIDVAIGDIITGQFTFNPANRDPEDLWLTRVQWKPSAIDAVFDLGISNDNDSLHDRH